MRVECKWFLFCVLLALGEGLAFLLSSYFDVYCAVLALSAVFALCSYGYDSRACLYAFVFLSGAGLAWRSISVREEVFARAMTGERGNFVEAEFRIPHAVEVKGSGRDGARVVFPSSCKGVDVSVNVFLPRGARIPEPGERWRCAGYLYRNPSKGVFGRHPFYVRGEGSCAVKLPGDAFISAARWLHLLKNDICGRIGKGIDSRRREVGLMKAMLLGQRSVIEKGTKEKFIASGTVHLFAISGLHVFVVTHLFSVLLGFLFVPMKLKAVVLICLVWLYVAITGAAPSAVRAGGMATICNMAGLFWRKGDPLTSWSQTFAFVHVLRPESLVDTGSLLSFTVMLGLLLWHRISCGISWRLFAKAAPGAVAWAFGVPIVAAGFGSFTPGALAANLIAVPMASFSVSFSALGVLASYFSEALARVCNFFSFMSLSIMVGVAEFVGSLPWSNFSVEPWSLPECFVWYFAVGVCFYVIYRHRTADAVV